MADLCVVLLAQCNIHGLFHVLMYVKGRLNTCEIGSFKLNTCFLRVILGSKDQL
jgi:hypothetical protein